MIKKNQQIFNVVNMFIDGMLVLFSYIISSCFWLAGITGNTDNMAMPNGEKILFATLVYAAFLWLVLAMLGFYNTDRLYSLRQKILRIVLGTTLSHIAAGGFFFFFRLEDFSRGVLIVFFILNILLLSAKYIFMRLLSRKLRAKGLNLKHVVVIGTGHLALQYAEDVERDKKIGYRVDGFIGQETDEVRDRLICGIDGLDVYLHTVDLDEVVIALDNSNSGQIQTVIQICEKNGLHFSVIPTYNDVITTETEIVTVGRTKLMSFRRNRQENVGFAFLKRSFDILASACGLIVLSPVLLAVAIGVKLSSPGPVFFKQVRIGLNRKPFVMYKFRSMRINTEETTAWSTDDDPRRTKFGAFIRKYSLDELPQLWNTLNGSMSLVGPRPELPHYVEQFRETIPLYMVKHQVRPGMTGWAQVNGYRGDTSIEKRIKYDLWYIEHWSPDLDLKILLMTVFGGKFRNEETLLSEEPVDSANNKKVS